MKSWVISLSVALIYASIPQRSFMNPNDRKFSCGKLDGPDLTRYLNNWNFIKLGPSAYHQFSLGCNEMNLLERVGMKKKYTFKVYGSGNELNWAEIPSKTAKEIISSGITDEMKDDLLDSESGITSDITIQIDGKSIQFNIDDLDKSAAIKKWNSGNPKKWYLLEVLGLQGLFYETVIEGPVDLKKITLHKKSYQVGNVALEQVFYSISYDGQECIEDFDFSDREFNDGSYYILSPKGEIIEVNSQEDSEDEDDDVDNLNEVSTQSKRLYVFKDKKSFDKFNIWIEKELMPRISEGLDEISEIRPEVKGKNHFEVLLIGREMDLASLPGPDTGWVQKEIGNFTVEK